MLWGGPCFSKSNDGSLQPIAAHIFRSLRLAGSLPVYHLNFSKTIAYRRRSVVLYIWWRKKQEHWCIKTQEHAIAPHQLSRMKETNTHKAKSYQLPCSTNQSPVNEILRTRPSLWPFASPEFCSAQSVSIHGHGIVTSRNFNWKTIRNIFLHVRYFTFLLWLDNGPWKSSSPALC